MFIACAVLICENIYELLCGYAKEGETLERVLVQEMRLKGGACVTGSEAAGKHLYVCMLEWRGRGKLLHSGVLYC